MQIIQQPTSGISIAAASKRFGRYKGEEEQGRRDLSVSGDEIQHLKNRREMLRNMDIEQAMESIESHNEMDFFQALALAKREGRVLIPHSVFDRILTDARGSILGWTGTVIVYERPDTAFGAQVVYAWKDNFEQCSVSVSIPQRFRGNAGCALVVEHPDFDLADLGGGNYRLRADDSAFSVIEQFPERGGALYSYDNIFRIPVKPGYARDNDGSFARKLWRKDGSFVGPITRGVDHRRVGGYSRGVYAYHCLSDHSSVALF